MYMLYALGAALLFTLSGLVLKFTSKHRFENDWVMFFYLELTLLPALILFALVFDVSLPSGGWWFIATAGITQLVGNAAYTLALRRIDASTAAPFFQLQGAFIALLAFLFLGERFAPINYLLLLVILLGSVLVSYTDQMTWRTYLSLGTLFIISTQLFHALSNLFVGLTFPYASATSVLFWMMLTSVIMTLILIPLFYRGSLRTTSAHIKPLLVNGFCAIFGAGALFVAFQTNLTISGVLGLLSAPMAFVIILVLSWFKPGLMENNSRKVYLIRFLGIVIIFTAAAVLTLSS